MIISVSYDGSKQSLEGDRELWLQQLPAGALITSATATVTPYSSPEDDSGDDGEGDRRFQETIDFDDSGGDQPWGATRTQDSVDTGGGLSWIVVDFNARRTLAGVEGSNLASCSLQVDLGGGFVDVNDRGAFLATGEKNLFELSGGSSSLPGFTVRRFKLTRDGATPPIVNKVTVRSAPSNVQLRLGGLGPFWFHAGELNRPVKTPDFAAVLQSVLADAAVAGGFAAVPLIVHSDSLCRLVVEIEIDYLCRVNVLPELLGEVLLPFDASGLAQADPGVLEIALPAGADVRGAAGRLRGSFQHSRVLAGPVGQAVPPGKVGVSPAVTRAQSFVVPATESVSAVDLPLAAVDRRVRLRLELRPDLDGRPGAEALPEAAAEVRLELTSSAAPAWVSVRLPAELRNQEEETCWLVLQSLEGAAWWSVEAAVAGASGLRHSEDGGLSWQPTADPTGDGPATGLFRLRRRPARFRMPIELQVGAGTAARRVSLARFEPQGRIDFELDLPEVVEGFNGYLEAAGPAVCPEHEHLGNAVFEHWRHLDDEGFGEVRVVSLGADRSPLRVVAPSLDERAYVLSSDPRGQAFLQVVDLAAAEVAGEVELPREPEPDDEPGDEPSGEAYRDLIKKLLESLLGLLKVTRIEYLMSLLGRFWQWLSKTDYWRRIELWLSERWSKLWAAARRAGRRLTGGGGEGPSGPVDLVVEPAGKRAFIALNQELRWVDLENLRHLTWADPAEDRPRPGRLALSRETLFVADHENQSDHAGLLVRGLALPDLDVVHTCDLGDGIESKDLVVSAAGDLYLLVHERQGNGDQIRFCINTDWLESIDYPGLCEPGRSVDVKGAQAMALTEDGETLVVVVANDSEHSVSLLSTAELTAGEPIKLTSAPRAVALEPGGEWAAVAAQAGLSVVDLETRKVSEPLTAGSSSGFSDVALTVAADRVLLTEPGPGLLHLVPIGEQRLADWQTAGAVRRAPRQAVILGVPPATSGSSGDRAAPAAALPAALWQVVAVTAGCRYDFSFRALASKPETVAEIAWLDAAGERRQTDTLLIETRSFDDVEDFASGAEPRPHRQRFIAPADAERAEVRFTVLTGAAILDAASLRGAGEEVINDGFLQWAEDLPTGWSRVPASMPGFTLDPGAGDGKDGIVAANAGKDPVLLFQTLPVEAGWPFELALQGHDRSSGLRGRLELRWLGKDDAPVAQATSLELRRHRFGRLAASGRVPPHAERIKVVLVIPVGAEIHLRQVSLRFPEPAQIPVSFVAQAPGELKVSEWWLSYDPAG